MNRRTLLRLLFTAGIVTSTVIACNQTNNQGSNPDEKLRIASILTLTGPAGQIGQEILTGQKLAVQYWNSKPGTKVELISEDSKNQPKDGLSAYQSLKARGYNFFTVNGSGVALAIKGEINEKEATLLALAAHPGITDPAKPGVFRYSSTATGEANTLTDWIQKSANEQTVVLFHSADEYGLAFANAMKASLKSVSKNIVIKEYRKEDVPQMRSLVQSALPKEAYLPVVVGVGQPMAQAITVLRTLGYQGPVLVNVGYALTGVQQQLGAQAGKIVYLTLDVNKSSDMEWVVKEYEKMNNRPLTPDAAIGFNSISLIVSASKNLNSVSPSQINPQLGAQAQSYLETKESVLNNEILVKVKVNEP